MANARWSMQQQHQQKQQWDDWEQQQGGWTQEEAPRPPSGPPPQAPSWQRAQPQAWQQQARQPVSHAQTGPAQTWNQGGSWAQQPPANPPAKAPLTTVKQEVTESGALPGETDREAKIRIESAKIRAELRKAREEAESRERDGDEKRKEADSVKEKKKEDEDSAKLEKMLPGLEEKTLNCEDEAEKVVIVAAPLAMEAVEELRELQLSAIRETERAVKAATSTVSLLRRELERKKTEVESFAPIAQETAKEEFGKIEARIASIQAKLDEHKTVRKDHELALQAEKLFGELAMRLASVEIDCEKAAMMAEPLAKALDTRPQEIAASEIRETKEALRVAQATLAPTMRLITGKVSGLKGPVKNKMLELQTRAESSQTMLDRAQKTVDEAQSRAACAPLLKQASEKVAAVEEVLQTMRESEAPFLMGLETMPAGEAAEVLLAMELAATTSHGAVADANKFINLKMVEVGRLAEGAAESARQEMERVKQQLDEAMERVKAFQAETTKRKRLNIVEVIKQKIDEAESAVSKMKEAGALLQSAEPDKVSEVLEAAHAAEVEAQKVVAVARSEVQEKQQDLKPLEGTHPEIVKSNSDMLRTKVRVNYMEAELTKFRHLAKNYEERIRVEKSLIEVTESLKEAETEIERLHEVSRGWQAAEKPPAEEEKQVTTVQNKLSSTTVQVEMKLQTSQGLETKELKGIFGRLQRAQWKLDRVKETARAHHRALATKIVRDATAAVHKAEAKVAEVSSRATPRQDVPISDLEQLNQEAASTLELVAEAGEAMAKGSASQLILEAKVEFARLQLRWKVLEKKGKAASENIASSFDRACTAATTAALEALRSAARKDGGVYDVDSLFTELSEGAAEISEKQFSDWFIKHKADVSISGDKVSFAFKKIAPHGLTPRIFANALADFYVCTRDITITDDFSIQSAKKIRKLDSAEILEALGGTKQDRTLELERVQCRAVRDGTVGWVTIKSNSGVEYLKRAPKPFLWCRQNVALHEKADPDSKSTRELRPGEVLELLEGPREQRLASDMRVRGVTCHEEAGGWLQVKDKSGSVFAKTSNKVSKCVSPIAMTFTPSFENHVRRIEVGEALEALDGEPEKTDGAMRRRFRACCDGKEGWVTVKGNQGKIYINSCPGKHYIVQQAAPLHAGLGAESPLVRVLMPGEAFTAYEEPKEVSGGEKQTVYRARSFGDIAEGWIIASSGEVQMWTSKHKVLRPVPLTRTLAANEAAEVIEVVRLLEPNEIVETTEHPTEDPSTGQLRVRCVALSDKAAGWATVREGATLALSLQPATPADEAAAAEALAAIAASAAAAKAAEAAAAREAAAPAVAPVSAGKGVKRAAPSMIVKQEKADFNKRPKGKGW